MRRRDRQAVQTDLREALAEDEEGREGLQGGQGGKVHSDEGRARSEAAEGGNLKTIHQDKPDTAEVAAAEAAAASDIHQQEGGLPCIR